MHDHASGPSIGSAVRRRRENLGLKQAELAELARCSNRFVHSVEAGKVSVRLDKLLDVLRVLGLGLRLGPGAPLSVDERLDERER